MSAPDSWEDMDDGTGQGHPANTRPVNNRLNANAPMFAFNPSATTFTPTYGGMPPGYYGQPMQYGQPGPYGAPPGYGGYQVPGYQTGNYGYGAPAYPPQQYRHNMPHNQHYVPAGPSSQPQPRGQEVGPPPSARQESRPMSSPALPVKQVEERSIKQEAPPPQKIPEPVVVKEQTPETPEVAVKEEAPVEPQADGAQKAQETEAPRPEKKEVEEEDWDEQEEHIEAKEEPSKPEVEEVQEKVAAVDLKKEASPKISPKISPKLSPKSRTPDLSPKAIDLNDHPLDGLEPEEDEDPRDHMNLVFIGHVDAGKSTIGGQILYLSGMVDKRTIEKFEREAKDKNRESWYMAYIMDTNEEERAKGKTVEVGRAHFETDKRRYTILDAPGHQKYVPSMIIGTSQADVGVLVIAARISEFETGFERGGQTREHAQLAKTLGVSKLVVVVNKMDDPSVCWSKERFDEIVTKMTPFLKQCGYNTKKDVQFLPISGLLGVNMKERISTEVCPWYDGPSFFETLDALEMPERDPRGLFRMPLIDKYKDMGTVVMGKIESGSVRRGDSLMVMPNRSQVKVVAILRDNDEVSYAKPGENLRIRVSGIEEEDILSGFVLSSIHSPISAVLEFDAQLQILELLDHKAIFTAGYKAVLHIHAVVEECEIIELLQQMDVKTKKWMKKKPLFVKSNGIITARIQVTQLICVEKFVNFPQLGRFTLRDEGKTVAIGKVTSLQGQD